MMSFPEAIWFGILQGITGLLPVSTYGHILLLKQVLSIPAGSGFALENLFHICSVFTVMIVFHKDVIQVIRQFISMFPDIWCNIKIFFYNRFHEFKEMEYQEVMYNNYRRFAGMLVISFLCSACIRCLFYRLSLVVADSALAIGLNFLITAVLLFVVDLWTYGKTVPKDMSLSHAVWIGLAHGFGIFPGISSLGIAITVCLLCGFRRNFAIRYTFLLVIPTGIRTFVMGGSDIWKLLTQGKAAGIYLSAMLCAVIVSLFSAKVLLRIVAKKRFRIFAVYSMLVGVLAIGYHFIH